MMAPVDRDRFQAYFRPLWDMLPDADGYNAETPVFVSRNYYWGDCTCGHEDAEDQWDADHPHGLGCFHLRYQAEQANLKAMRLDFEQQHDRLTKWAVANGYPDAPIGMAFHCDCGKQTAREAWYQAHPHPATCPTQLPNFVYKPTGFEVSWYKYPFRGATANREISRQELKAMVDDCIASLREGAADENAHRQQRKTTP